ncbi:MAG: hypothetical protein AB7N71_06000 [Phycisphaerae bacterium]
MISVSDPTRYLADAEVGLAPLAELFDTLVARDVEAVLPHDVPPPFDRLLVHEDHMTVRLAEYHGNSVELSVLNTKREGDAYAREILLTVPGSDKPVEIGVVRIDLTQLEAGPRDEILAKDRPLGEILIRHNVLRRVEPRWFYKLPVSLRAHHKLDAAPHEPVYGRVGVIHCNEKPAIELLEIVRA